MIGDVISCHALTNDVVVGVASLTPARSRDRTMTVEVGNVMNIQSFSELGLDAMCRQ